MKKTIMIGLMAGLLVLGGGCALVVVGGAAAAGVGGYAYVKGEVKTTESATLNKAWDATLAAMKDLEYPVISQGKDALSAEVTVRNASDTKITIKLAKAFETTTEIRIRVGTFGDEALSRTILEKIKKHL